MKESLLIFSFFYPLIAIIYFFVCIESKWGAKDSIVRAVAWPLLLIKNIVLHLKDSQ